MRMASRSACAVDPENPRIARVGSLMADSERWLMRGLMLGSAAVLLLTVVLAGGCGDGSRDAAVSMKGWSLTPEEVRDEYELIHGEGSFDEASLETREAFARTLADKEILLDAAIRSEKSLRGRFARKVRIAHEKNLVDDFLNHRRSQFTLSEERFSEQLPMISRAAHIRYSTLRDPEDKDAVHAGQTEGAGFEELARKYGKDLRNPELTREGEGHYWTDAVLRVDNLRHPPELVANTLLVDLKDGAMPPPVVSSDAVFLVELKGYTPIEGTDTELFLQRARQILEYFAYREDFESWTDGFEGKYGFRTHPESYPVIISGIAGFRDSIRSAADQGSEVDYGALEPPIWRFLPEDLGRPVYEMNGETHTVLDFLESLRSVDLDLWAALPDPDKAAVQIDNRLIRFPIQEEAKEAGFDERPQYKTGLRRITEEAWLDQFVDTIGRKIEPTEDDFLADYERRAATRYASELIAISVLTWPADLKPRAEEVLEQLQAADSLGWFALAEREEAADGRMGFIRESEPQAVARMSQDDPLFPLYSQVVSLPAGAVSELFESGEDSYSVVRVLKREPHPVREAFDAPDVTDRRVRRQLREARIEQVLDEGRSSRNVSVNLELLAP